MVTQDLFLTVTLTTLMHVFIRRLLGRKGQLIHGAALGAGVLASVALAAVKFNTRLIISSHWNHYIYAVILPLTLLVLLLTLLCGRREKRDMRACGAVLCAAGSLLSATLVFYSLPGVLLYPFSFNTMGQGYLSSYYAVRMAGWLGALVLLYVCSRLLSRCALYIKPYALVPIALNAGLLSFAAYCFGRFFVPWVNRAKWLKWPVKYTDAAYGWIGNWMMFTANHSMLFIWIAAGIAALLAVLLFRQGTVIREPYDNPAQLRKRNDLLVVHEFLDREKRIYGSGESALRYGCEVVLVAERKRVDAFFKCAANCKREHKRRVDLGEMPFRFAHKFNRLVHVGVEPPEVFGLEGIESWVL